MKNLFLNAIVTIVYGVAKSFFSLHRRVNIIPVVAFCVNRVGHDRVAVNLNLVGRQWNLWTTTGGKEGTEPPDWVKEFNTRNEARWSSVSGSDEYNKLVQEGYVWDQANLPAITIVESVKYPMIANKKLRNVPVAGFAIACNFAGEQLWFGE